MIRTPGQLGAALAALALLLFSGRASAQTGDEGPGQRFELLERRGGLAADLLPLPDGRLMLARGESLALLSFSGDEARLAGELQPGIGPLLDLQGLEGGRALLLGAQGLLSLDLALWPPVILGSMPGGAQAIRTQGDLVALPMREAGLRLLRLQADGQVQLLAEIHPEGGALDAAFRPDGQALYVAEGARGLSLYDLRDPAQPALAGSVPGVEAAYLVTAAGALLAVDTGSGLALIDPAAGGAGQLGQFSGLRGGRRFELREDYLYVADGEDGLRIFWLAAPDRPLQVYGDREQGASDLALDGNLAIISGPESLRGLDISDPYRPRELGRVTLPGGEPQGLSLGGGRAFVALGEAGVGSFGISAAEGPRLLGLINLRGRAPDAVAFDTLFYEDRLYVAAGPEGVVVLEAARPGAETFLTSLRLPGPALAIDRRGDVLLIAAGEAGLLAVDITRPEQPTLIGTLPPPPGLQTINLRVEGRRALLAHAEAFSVADIGDVERMGALVTLDSPAQDALFNGIYLYALDANRIHIFDARANAEPLALRSYHGLDEIRQISAQGDRLILSAGPQGPAAVSISIARPERPFELENSGAGGALQALSVGGTVWLARGYEGLSRYEETEGGAWIPRGGLAGLPGFETLDADSAGWIAAGENLLISEDAPGGSLRLEEGVRIYDLAREGQRIALALGPDGLALAERSGSTLSLIAQQRERSASALIWHEGRLIAGGPQGLSLLDGESLIALAELSTPAPVSSLLLLPEGRLLAGLADGSLAQAQLADPSRALIEMGRAESRRPLDLIQGPDDRLYGLADDQLYEIDMAGGGLSLRRLGSTQISAGRGLWLDEQLALIHPGEALRFYDLARLGDATIPARLLALPLSPSEESILPLEAGWLVAAGSEGLWLIHPQQSELNQQLDPGEVHALWMQEGDLFTAGSELVRWDPATLEPQQRLTLGSRAHQISAGPRGLLLISTEDGLLLADPQTLQVVGAAPGPSVQRAAWIGSRAYLALAGGGLGLADLSDPAAPSLPGSLALEGARSVLDLLALPDGSLLISGEGGLIRLRPDENAPLPALLRSDTLSSGPLRAIAVEGERIALARGAEGVLLLRDTAAGPPEIETLLPVPGGAQALALQGEMLYVAAGECGLRAYTLRNPVQPIELGSFRAGYASDLALRGETLLLADSEGLLTLRFDASLPAAPPPRPRSPQPFDGAGGQPNGLTLSWGPAPDPCEALGYEIYVGTTENPPLAGRSVQASYEIGDLEPLQVYHWRVVVTDRQGERSEGPLWRFSTGPGQGAENLPDAPPLLGENRNGPLFAVLITLGLALLAGAGLYLQARRKR